MIDWPNKFSLEKIGLTALDAGSIPYNHHPMRRQKFM